MFVSRKFAVLLAALCALALTHAETQAASKKNQAKKESPEPRLVPVTYPVADLVVPLDGPFDKNMVTLESKLIELIQNTIAPGSWDVQGGRATAQYFPLGMGLVVMQTRDNQERIHDLLAALRRLQDFEVALEVRLVTISGGERDEFYTDLLDFRELGGKGPGKSVQGTFLSDRQLRRWMEMAQGDRRYSVLSAPKITVFNGQSAKIDVSERREFDIGLRQRKDGDLEVVRQTVKEGLQAAVLPVVTPDLRNVRVRFDLKHISVEGQIPTKPVRVTHVKDGLERIGLHWIQEPKICQLTLDKVLTIPDGKTLLCRLGTTKVESRTEHCPPVLEGIPILEKLFTRVSYGLEDREVFLMVTPRIIVADEIEVEEPLLHLNELPPPMPRD